GARSFHRVFSVRGWSLKVEQGSTCKFAEMTLKRSGSFIDLAGMHSQRDRTSAVTIFSFLAFFLGLADRPTSEPRVISCLRRIMKHFPAQLSAVRARSTCRTSRH